MFKNVFVVCLLVLSVFCWLPEQANAQIGQTGTLNGSVLGPDNQYLPGVQVKIESPALLLPSMTTLSNEKGFYRFPALPPGMYKMTFELQGFASKQQKNVLVNASKTTTINMLMELTTLTETVQVSGTTPTIDKERTNAVTNLSAAFIQSIPASRDIATFFNMIPGVTGDTAHGGSVRDNTYNLDGVNVTDPVTGTQGGSFSMDVAEEISVQTGGHSAEYGSIKGAVINVVTKSGGNNFSGMASVYYRSNKLQSVNNKGTVWEGLKAGIKKEVEPSFTLGGPIVKNKVWFFANVNLKDTTRYALGFPYNAPNTITPKTKAPMIYGKLTTQLGKNDKLTLSYNYSNSKNDNRGASAYNVEETTWIQDVPIKTYNLQLSHFFGSNFIVNLKGGYMDYHLNLSAKNDLPNVYDQYTGMNYLSYGYDDWYTRRRLQIQGDGTTFIDNAIGSHELKFGFEVEHSTDLRDDKWNRDSQGATFLYLYNGEWWYADFYQDFARKDEKLLIGAFVTDQWNPSDRLTVNLGFRYDHNEGIIPAQGQNRQVITAYGVTFDPRVLKKFKPLKWDTIAPRLGVTYDLTGDGKTAIKATANRYYAANIMQYFVTVNPNAFLGWSQDLDENGHLIGQPYEYAGQANTTIDPNLKSPYTDEVTFGIERELFKNWRFGARYIHKWDKNLIEDVDTISLDYAKLMAGGDLNTLWKNWTQVTGIDKFDGKTVTFWSQIDTSVAQTIITNPPGATRKYDGIEVTLDKRFSNRWAMNASYVFAKSKGLIGTDFNESWSGQGYFNNPNAHTNAIGEFELERRNQAKVQISYQGPWGINLGAYYRFLSGTPYTRVIANKDLGIKLNQTTNTAIFAETRGSRTLPNLSVLDFRFDKSFKLPGKAGRVSVFVDIFNAFNADTATGVWNVSSRNTRVNGKVVKFLGATSMLDPRIFRLGAKFEF